VDRLISSMITGSKLIICYLIAAAFQLTFMVWPNFDGDPHIPFSAFPWSLIWSPYVPIDTVLEMLTSGADPMHMKVILVFGAAFIASFATLFWMPQFLRKNA
jgi:hypothetical protein